MTITFSDFWNIFKKCALLMLVCAILVSAATCVYFETRVRKIYSTSFSATLRPQTNDATTSVDMLEDLSLSIAVGDAYLTAMMIPLTSEKMAEKILAYLDASELPNMKLDYEYTSLQIANMLEAEHIDKLSDVNYRLNVLFTVSAYSAEDCARIAYAFRECMDSVVYEYLPPAYTLEPHSNNVYVGQQSSSSGLTNAFLAALVVAILIYGVALLICVLDKRIYTSEDLKRQYEKYAILGQIPRMD